MKSKIRKGMFITELPMIDPPKESASKKTLLVASSHGPKRTALRVDGKPVVVNVSAYVRPDGYVSRAKRQKNVRTVRRVRRSKSNNHTSVGPHHRR